MKRALFLATFAAVAACNVQRDVKVTFGETGGGLDGFMCEDDSKSDGGLLLDRLMLPDAGTITASVVTDFVTLGGLPDGCRTNQLIRWCATHTCAPGAGTRRCQEIQLPTNVGGMPRGALRAAILAQVKTIKDPLISLNAPDEPVMLRVLATRQPCAYVMTPDATGKLPEYVKSDLVGCAYTCPTLFDRVEQDVEIFFDTLTSKCEQGVRTCSDSELHWQN